MMWGIESHHDDDLQHPVGCDVNRSVITKPSTWPVRWLVVGTLALFVVHLLLSAGRWTPVIAPDEIGVISMARYLAGVAPMMHMEHTPHISFGLSLLLAPGFALLPNPYWAYKFAVVLGCLLAALVLPLAYLVGRRFGDPRQALVAASLTALYPALFVQTQYVWAEVSLMFGFLALCWFALRAIEQPTLPRLLLFSVTACFLYALHERAIAVPLVAMLFVLGLGLREGRHMTHFIAVACLIAVLAWAVRMADLYFWQLGWGGEAGITVGSLAGRISAPADVLAVVKAALLQAWYVLVASFGLVAIGVCRMLLLARRANSRRWSGMRLFAGLLVLCSLSVWFASSVMMMHPFRADQYVYGRYNEGFLLPWICIGATALGTPLRGRLVAWIAIVVVALSGIAWLTAGVAHWQYLIVPNVTGVAAYFHALQSPAVFAAGGVLTLAVLAWIWLTRARLWLCMLGPTAAFMVLTIITMPLVLQLNRHMASLTQLGRTLLPDQGIAQIAYDMDRLPRYLYYHFQALLPGVDVVTFQGASESPRANIVIADAGWGAAHQGIQSCVIGREPSGAVVYWALRKRANASCQAR